jgi:hypothetical protein
LEQNSYHRKHHGNRGLSLGAAAQLLEQKEIARQAQAVGAAYHLVRSIDEV